LDLVALEPRSIESRWHRLAKTGGTPVLVTTTAPLFGANLAVDATSIYWFGDSIQKSQPRRRESNIGAP